MRETKKIILPKSNIVVEIYTYLSQRGYEAIRYPFIRDKKIKFVEGKGVVSEGDNAISMSSMTESNKANIKYMLYSVDGKTGTIDSLYDMIIDLCQEDYNFVVKEINKVTETEITEEKSEEELKKKLEE